MAGLLAAAGGQRAVATAFADRDEVGEHRVDEEAEPHAFAAALGADAVHAVVPVAATHQRQAVRTAGQAVINGSSAMLEQRAGVPRQRRLLVRLRLARRERWRREERHLFVQDASVAGGAHVFGDHEWQPQQIIRAAAAKAAARRFVPPMLHVTFHELAPGRAQNVFARQLRSGQQQGHHVLQLIAEPIGAARLVVAGAGPDSA